MAKRIADKELTDRNWDQEEEGEEVSRSGLTEMLLLGHICIRIVDSDDVLTCKTLSSIRPGRFQLRVKMC